MCYLGPTSPSGTASLTDLTGICVDSDLSLAAGMPGLRPAVIAIYPSNTEVLVQTNRQEKTHFECGGIEESPTQERQSRNKRDPHLGQHSLSIRRRPHPDSNPKRPIAFGCHRRVPQVLSG